MAQGSGNGGGAGGAPPGSPPGGSGPPARTPPGEPRLLHEALGLPAITFQGITHMAPAAGMMLSAPFVATFAGPALGLAFGVAGLVALILASSVGEMAKHIPSAGGYFTYIGKGLNPKLGFLAAWMYFVYDPIVPVLCTTIIGLLVEDTLKSLYGFTFPWWVFSLIVWAGLAFITYVGIKPSIRVSVLLSVIEVGITLALSFTIFGKNGISGHDLAAGFTLQQVPVSPAPRGLFLALVFSVLSYTGFEATAPLAEETKNPRRNVAIGAVLGVVAILLYYIIFGFATSVGFGVDKMSSAFTSTENPYYIIANSVWGKGGTILVLLALVNSGWGCSLAGQNAVVRVYYKMGKVGVLPSALGRLHPRYRSPHIAIAFQTVVSVVIGIITGVTLGPATTFGVFGAMITFGMIFVYGCGLVTVSVMYLREHRDEFNIWLHLILPIIGLVMLVTILYYNVRPFPVYPFNIAPITVAVWFLVGVAVVVWLSRTRPRELDEGAREIFADVEEEPHLGGLGDVAATPEGREDA
jgi:amino acid transporter